MQLKTKEKILILYHSGAGSTKLTSEILAQQLQKTFNVSIEHINFKFDYKKLYNYDLLVFGFPTYHCEPSTSMMDFIKQIPNSDGTIKTFFFTSYGLYTGNCLRIFYQELIKRHFKILRYYQFRSPASDGILMFSSRLKFMFNFEKNYTNHIKRVVTDINNYKKLNTKRKPLYKWYVPLNEIAKYYGEKEYNKMRDRIHIVTELCTNCNLCVINCERICWTSNKKEPTFKSDNCEFCMECIHKCPQKAIIFSDKMINKSRLDTQFFKNKKKKIFESLCPKNKN